MVAPCVAAQLDTYQVWRIHRERREYWRSRRATGIMADCSENRSEGGLMAEISIVQEHHLTPKKAREAAQKVADKIADEYDLECAWEGDVLHFERSGVQGSLTLEKKQVEMNIKLGFLMSVFASAIEAKVAENMKKVFGAA
jgi:putative polyhydroxyalkanoate system protein